MEVIDTTERIHNVFVGWELREGHLVYKTLQLFLRSGKLGRVILLLKPSIYILLEVGN